MTKTLSSLLIPVRQIALVSIFGLKNAYKFHDASRGSCKHVCAVPTLLLVILLHNVECIVDASPRK